MQHLSELFCCLCVLSRMPLNARFALTSPIEGYLLLSTDDAHS